MEPARRRTTASILRDFVTGFINKTGEEVENKWALAAAKRYEVRGRVSRPLSDLKADLRL